jgi:hypothetical protein
MTVGEEPDGHLAEQYVDAGGGVGGEAGPVVGKPGIDHHPPVAVDDAERAEHVEDLSGRR